MKQDHKDNTSEQARIIRISLLIDLMTVAPVITVAVLSNSLAMMTDIFDYAHSIMANLVSWLILRRLARGTMRFSDYGPGKLESLGGLAVSCIMLAGLAAMAVFSLKRFFHPAPIARNFALAGLGMYLIGFAVNGWLWRRTFLLARETRSHIMEAQWRKNRLDALSGLFLIVCLLLSLLFSRYGWTAFLDPAFALALAVVTGASFAGVIQEALADILDRTLSEEAQMKVLRRLAENFEFYDSFQGVRSRRVGARTFIEIMLGFDPERRIGDALDVEGRLREALEQEIPGCDVRVVLNPAEDYREGFSVRSDVSIVPLAEKMIPETMEIIRVTFPRDNHDEIREELEESVRSGRHAEALAARNIIRPRYWAAVYGETVVGVTGLYFKADDPEAVWGGWTASSPASRASISRVKMLLLRKVAFECRNTGRHYLRLDTTTLPGEAQANRLYDRIGLKVYRSEPCGDYTRLYRQIPAADMVKVAKLGKERPGAPASEAHEDTPGIR